VGPEVVKEEVEAAVSELRAFIAEHADSVPEPGSRTALQLEAARRAVASYDEAERVFGSTRSRP
jgi:hypothetical protein